MPVARTQALLDTTTRTHRPHFPSSQDVESGGRQWACMCLLRWKRGNFLLAHASFFRLLLGEIVGVSLQQ